MFNQVTIRPQPRQVPLSEIGNAPAFWLDGVGYFNQRDGLGLYLPLTAEYQAKPIPAGTLVWLNQGITVEQYERARE